MRIMQAAMVTAVLVWACGWALAATSMIKDVPQGAQVLYVVRGHVVQTMTLRPGRYRITVEELK